MVVSTGVFILEVQFFLRDTLVQKISFCIIKYDNIQGEATDKSAESKSLVATATCLHGGRMTDCLFLCFLSKPYTMQVGAIPGTFQHGVASGDPASSTMVVWTRVTPDPDIPTTTTLCVQLELKLSSNTNGPPIQR